MVENLSSNEKVNIILVPFSEWSCCYNTGQYFYNLGTQKQACIDRINALYFEYGTNLGDGMRFAYHELKRAVDGGKDVGSIFLVLMTDGAMNSYSKGSYTYKGTDFCIGSAVNSGTNYQRNDQKARDYAELWGKRWTNDFTLAKTWLLSLANGMSDADKAVLRDVFGEEPIDIDNLTDFVTVFEDIGSNIEEIMWAFEGPKL